MHLETIQPNRSVPPGRQAEASKGEHFILLDATRTLAAIGVVCWHWQHFFMVNSQAIIPNRNDLPFYSLLFPFYDAGWMAVDFFFMLSGFVMSWTYLERIRSQSTGMGRFAILRLSRLYPLHLLTLLAVAILQYGYIRLNGHGFVYQFNNLYHFSLHLFMASQWGFQRGPSFNDPIWSVSVEVLLYALFYLLARFTGYSAKIIISLSFLGFLLFAINFASGLGRGLFCFFIGCLLVEGLKVANRFDSRTSVEAATYLGLVAATFVTVGYYQHHVGDALAKVMSAMAAAGLPGVSSLQSEMAERLRRIFDYAIIVTLFYPVFMFSLMMIERRVHRFVASAAGIGNISYSSYLIHFPLQLICVLLFPAELMRMGGAVGEIVFLSFLAVLLSLSFCSNSFFERPVQNIIRSFLPFGRSSGSAVASRGASPAS